MTEERWFRALPLALLALATVIAMVAVSSLGDAAGPVWVTLVLTALTGAWIVLVPRPSAVHYGGRTVLAFALCWLNPFYAVFAYVGFIDAYESLRGRWVYVGILAVAVTQAGSQSGGFPPEGAAQLAVFAALLLLNAGLSTALMKLSERTENRNAELERLNVELERALADKADLQAQLVAQARQSGVQDERQRLAREMHDTLAQSLAGIVTQLEASVGGERQERALRLARQALVEARRSVLDLSPADLDGTGLEAAVTAVVTAWATEGDVLADVVVTGEPAPLHPEVEATVLRIVQESLTNVAKHAAAGRVVVTLSYDGDEVVLDVRDDGAGFDPGAETPASSFGLRGMRQRAERLSGALALESRPGGGTAVSLRLPALARGAA